MGDKGLNDFLHQVELFANLDDRSLELLASVSHTRKLAKGQFLFFQDDPGEAAYIVKQGIIGIVLTTLDGRELVINEMREGDCFGELALLQAEPRSASAVALEDSQVVRIPRKAFLEKVETEPAMMRILLETNAARLRNSGERESALAFMDAPARLARFLLQRSEQEKLPDLITLSQEEIAQYIGVTRQTIAKILGKWRRDRWVITGRGKIMLLNYPALRETADQE